MKIIRLSAGDPPSRAVFQGRRVLLFEREARWYALVGLPLDLAVGPHAIEIHRGGRVETERFTVNAKHYPVQQLRIPDQRKVDPSPTDLARIRREQQLIADVKNRWEDRDDVELDFVLPANGPLSSRFGLRRVLNGQPRAPHAGLDVAIPRGTPIGAAAAGVVTHVGDFFFNGKTVFVDHGQGLVSMYCHLDEIGVQPGQRVTAAASLGLSGMTGRVTGPHLHWGIFLNGTLVDPELFVGAAPNR